MLRQFFYILKLLCHSEEKSIDLIIKNSANTSSQIGDSLDLFDQTISIYIFPVLY